MAANFDVVVIGGGPVGILAARECAELGLRTALVSDGPLGGRAGWDSLVPSRVLIDAAHHWRSPQPPDADAWARIQERMRELSEAVHGPDEGELRKVGVVRMTGRARFAGAHRLMVRTPGGNDDEVDFASAIIATGTVPNFPEGLRPNGEQLLAPRMLRTMPPPKESMMVVGGGVTGAEMAYAFSALGVKVKWVVARTGLLSRFSRDAVDELLSQLRARGVELLPGELAVSAAADRDDVVVRRVDGDSVRAASALLALGRRADTESLNLREAGLVQLGGPIEVDGACRTMVPHLYAAGDVTGAPYVLNKGLSQAWTAARAVANRPFSSFDLRSVVEATYSHPELARVGWTLEQATQHGLDARSHLVRTRPGLRDRLEQKDAQPGFLEVVVGPSGDLLGATAVHPRAADLITSLAFAVRERAHIADVASLFPASPTSVELAFEALRAAALKH